MLYYANLPVGAAIAARFCLPYQDNVINLRNQGPISLSLRGAQRRGNPFSPW